MDIALKNLKLVELNVYVATVFLNTQILYVHIVTKIINKNLMKSQKKDFLIHKNFLNMIIISLFYCYGKVFILTNI